LSPSPEYAPIPITDHAGPRRFARWPDESMNMLWIAAVASASGYVFQPMFSPARSKQ
jgi:hypothetical protein